MPGIMTAEDYEALLTECGLGELGASPETLMDPDRLDRCSCTRLADLRQRRRAHKKNGERIGTAEQCWHLWRGEQLHGDIL